MSIPDTNELRYKFFVHGLTWEERAWLLHKSALHPIDRQIICSIIAQKTYTREHRNLIRRIEDLDDEMEPFL